jgi:hypothetical protein
MGDDQHPSDHAQTLVKFSLSIAPASSADDRVTGLLSNLVFDLATLVGCSRKTASQVNVLCVEETAATLEENMFSSGELKVDLAIVGEKVRVHSAVRPAEVEIPGTESWFQPDEPQRDMGKTPSKTIRRKRSDLLAQTVEDRRVDRAQGGLGLMRLTEESKFKLGPDGNKGDNGNGGGSEGEGGSSAPAATVVPLRKGPS